MTLRLPSLPLSATNRLPRLGVALILCAAAWPLSSSAQTTLRAQPGQSLNDLAAEATQSHDPAVLARAAHALFVANPKAFLKNNPSLLRGDALLVVPPLDATGALAESGVAAASASGAGVPNGASTAGAASVAAKGVQAASAAAVTAVVSTAASTPVATGASKVAAVAMASAPMAGSANTAVAAGGASEAASGVTAAGTMASAASAEGASAASGATIASEASMASAASAASAVNASGAAASAVAGAGALALPNWSDPAARIEAGASLGVLALVVLGFLWQRGRKARAAAAAALDEPFIVPPPVAPRRAQPADAAPVPVQPEVAEPPQFSAGESAAHADGTQAPHDAADGEPAFRSAPGAGAAALAASAALHADTEPSAAAPVVNEAETHEARVSPQANPDQPASAQHFAAAPEAADGIESASTFASAPTAAQQAPEPSPYAAEFDDDEPLGTPPAGLPARTIPQDAIAALDSLDMSLPTRVPGPLTPHEPTGEQGNTHAFAQRSEPQPHTAPQPESPPETGIAPAAPSHEQPSHEQPSHELSPSAPAGEQTSEYAFAQPHAEPQSHEPSPHDASSASAALSGAQFAPLRLDFNLEHPAAPSAAWPAPTPEALLQIARNKLDLADEYIALGDLSSARMLAQEVLDAGYADTREAAHALLAKLAELS